MGQPDFTFGRVGLSLRPRLLQIDGKQIELGSRALDILVALAENVGATVDKNALIKRAWPDVSVERACECTLLPFAKRWPLYRNCPSRQFLDGATGSISEPRVLVEAPGVRILATCRESLRVAGECVLRLPALDLPTGETVATLEQATTFSATAMFVDRVLSGGGGLADRDSASLAEICRKLDGVPLAIEIAEAHVGALGLRAVESQIGTRFALATKGRLISLSRHQTLQSTLDWSFGLLTSDEQAALRALSIFAAGFTLAGAASVVDPDLSKATAVPNLVADLVSKSLIVVVGAHPLPAASSATSEPQLRPSFR